ncbi:MAG: rubredoxin [Pseudoflavonifractor sp.]
MRKFVCKVCGFVYDEAKGIPGAGIAPGTTWENLPEGWVCPLCGASQAEFRAEEAAPAAPKPVAQAAPPEDKGERSALELSILCSNLARGCEKQYKPAEAALYTELADYFKASAAPGAAPEPGELLALVEQDLAEGFPRANAAAALAEDRGAMRALVWSEKVSYILKSLLTRQAKEGEEFLDHSGLYVCSICGFIYAGDTPPDICPVCKVPSWKFEKIEGGTRV